MPFLAVTMQGPRRATWLPDRSRLCWATPRRVPAGYARSWWASPEAARGHASQPAPTPWTP